MLLVLLTIVHVVVCGFLIIVVLLQSGQAADLAGAFGGMGSQTAFGPRGSATLLSKSTAVAAALFMMTSLALAVLETRNAGSGSSAGSSVLDTHPKTTQTKPAAPAPANRTPAPPPVQVHVQPTAPKK